jgi:hypothetical protein
MATVDDYRSGRILQLIRIAHFALRLSGIAIIGPLIKRKLEQRMVHFCIRPITLHEAAAIIGRSRNCAAGPRVCQPLFPQSSYSESVFLDALAEGMVKCNKARSLSKEQAIETLMKYPRHPLVISKVSDQYMEICRSEPEVCIYWKMRKAGQDH